MNALTDLPTQAEPAHELSTDTIPVPSALEAGAELAAAHGLDRGACELLALAVQGAVTGGSRRLRDPEGGQVLPVLNLLVAERLAPALAALVRPVEEYIARILRQYQDRDTRSLLVWKRRTEKLLAETEQELGQHQEPFWDMTEVERAFEQTGDLQAYQRRARPAKLKEIRDTERPRLTELGLACRPLLLTPALDAMLLRQWSEMAFDRLVSCVCPHDGGFEGLAVLGGADQRQAMRLLQAAASGRELELFGGRPVAGAGLCALWAVGTEDLLAVHRHRVLGRPGNLACFVIVDPDDEVAGPQVPSTRGELWRAHLTETILGRRLAAAPVQYDLHPEAVEACREYRQRAAGAPADTERGVAHLRRLPRLALALSLGFHLAGDRRDEREIDLQTFLRGRDLATRASSMHLESLRRLERRVAQSEVEAKLRAIIGRIEKRGPLTKRELQRSFDKQRWADLQPAIELGVERRLLRWSDDGRLDLFSGPDLSVSVCK